MPKRVPSEVREAIKTHLLDGKLDHLQIADEVGTSLQRKLLNADPEIVLSADPP
jgi:hypothetical protein